MQYDFSSYIPRWNTGSPKWNQMKTKNPDISPDTVPFSTADMELKNPPEIIGGLQEYLANAVLGYTMPEQSYYDAVCRWMAKRHGWQVEKDSILCTPGVVEACFIAVKALTQPGEGVIIMTPVYYPFYGAIERNGRRIVKNPLIEEDGHYRIDFDNLEQQAKRPDVKALLLCSPHNPVGRVWTKEELTQVGRICLDNGVKVISDEIHFDLIMPPYAHTVFASISEEFSQNSIVCTAPSKTFNLAGLQTSNIVIPNPELRKRFQDASLTGHFMLNILGYQACEIAYTRCEKWLDELLLLLWNNHVLLKEYLAKHLPQVKVYDLEGTYLQWMDFRAFGMDKDALEAFMHAKPQIFCDEGSMFGEEGDGFERMNLACPTKVMMAALERIVTAFKAL